MSIHTCSIKQGDDVVISSSQCSWANVKTNSYLKFKNKHDIFKIKRTEKISLIYDFKVLNPQAIEVEDDIGINLFNGDEINLIYKEYELLTIFSISNAGLGYREGDKVKLEWDSPSFDVVSGLTEFALLEIDKVDNLGKILSIKILSKGKYLQEPKESVLKIIGGKGSGGALEVVCKETSSKKIIERVINHIEYDIPPRIYLSNQLPNGLNQGKLCVDKWRIFLDSKSSENLINHQYEIIHDFTPNLNLPLLAPNSFSRDAIINQNLLIIDLELKKIKESIEELVRQRTSGS